MLAPFSALVCGTGTGVGKTHVACAIAAARRPHGPFAPYKPVESGFDAEGGDSARLARASGRQVRPPRYALRAPVSPHLAARAEGTEIDLDEVVAACSGADLVETAGGLLTPLSVVATNLDLCVRLRPRVIVLVASDRLGVLHEVRASSLALAAVGLADRVLVALSAPERPDASTGTNAAELALLGWARPVVFPRAAFDAVASVAAADLLCAGQ